MCQYTATHHPTCSHTSFHLYVFCRRILHELNRINDPVQREAFALPFDPPDCEPRRGVTVIRVGVGGGECPFCCRYRLFSAD